MSEAREISTPRDAARALIYEAVKHGDSLESLAYGRMGYAGPRYCAKIGGAIGYFTGEGPDTWVQQKKLTAHEIGVSEVAGEPCVAVFSLDRLYREIQQELAAEASGAPVQVEMWQ